MGIKLRGGIYYCRLKIRKREFFASCRTGSKMRAQALDDMIKTAVRRQDPNILDGDGRDLARRLFSSHVNEIIPGFFRIEEEIVQEQAQGITLIQACEKLHADPDTKRRDHGRTGKNQTTYRQRMKHCMEHLLQHLGPDTPVLSLQILDIKDYRIKRLNENAAPATINKEIGILSKVFRCLIERGLCENNPCKQIRPLPTKDSVRQVYISYKDFLRILERLPQWFKPLALLAYWAAMRAGEIRGLRRDQIDLKKRVLRLNAMDTKERGRKVIPLVIHLVDLLRQRLSAHVVGLDRVFLVDGRPIEKDDLKRPWEAAVKAAGLPDVNFHDLRHTWRRNARKSSLDPDIRKSIMGHWWRGKNVDEAYDLFDDEDYVREIDKLTVDHGDTKIWLMKKEKKEKTPQVASAGSLSDGGSKGDHQKAKAKGSVGKP